ncbi:hypothetical protein [Cellulosimicrobium sp. Marseille-Q4280]|uniref:hypothetical protein n=1 Tax=Cellulosimicrobium sp. Marseille-Q4280 TaxID=2937992 RepID=UPI0020426467|nr:hypothetical protein [Cellulosimicrobium sp. Marseille-Q4280]
MTTTLPGLPYLAPATTPTDDLQAATGDANATWLLAETQDVAPGDLVLLGVEGTELAVAVVVEVNQHWAAVLPAAVAGANAAGRLLTPAGLPAVQAWPVEVSVHTGLIERRIAPVATASELAALTAGASDEPMPGDIEALWSSLNLGIDTGR